MFAWVLQTMLSLRQFLKPQESIFPVQTSQPVNNIYIIMYYFGLADWVLLWVKLIGYLFQNSITVVYSDAPIWKFTDIPITDILGPILADTDIQAWNMIWVSSMGKRRQIKTFFYLPKVSRHSFTNYVQ